MHYSVWTIRFTFEAMRGVKRRVSLYLVQPEKWNIPSHSCIHEAIKEYFVEHDFSNETVWSGTSYIKEGRLYHAPEFVITETPALLEYDKESPASGL